MLIVWHLIKGTFKIETLVNPDDCHWSNVSAQVVEVMGSFDWGYQGTESREIKTVYLS
jgi:hypothetical protein